MDVAAVEELGRALQLRADQLRHVSTEIEGAIGALRWGGPDGAAFRERWWPEHRRRLLAVADALHGFGQSALGNASEQREASGERGALDVALGAACALPAGHTTAGVVKTSFAWGDFISRIEDVAGEDAFELLQVSIDPPKYIVLLPGIELDAWNTDSVRDLHAAVPARLLQRDAYAARVMLELQRAGVPAGAEVMLMGHSYGAIAAMNLASDPQFNQPGNASASGDFHVQVSHVVAAGAGVRDWIDRPPPGTEVLLSLNRRDHVATAIQAGRVDQSVIDSMTIADELPGVVRAAREGFEHAAFGAVASESITTGEGRVVHEFTAANDPSGHHYDNYRTGFGVVGGAADTWLDGAARHYFVGHPEMVATRIAVKD